MVQCVGWSILKWSLSIVEVALSSLFYAPPFEKVAFTLPTAWEQVWEGHPPPPPREAVPCPNAPSFGGRRSHPEQGHRSIYPGRQHPAFGRWRPPWCASPGSATGAPCTTRVRGAERSGGIRGIPILRELLRSRGRRSEDEFHHDHAGHSLCIFPVWRYWVCLQVNSNPSDRPQSASRGMLPKKVAFWGIPAARRSSLRRTYWP